MARRDHPFRVPVRDRRRLPGRRPGDAGPGRRPRDRHARAAGRGRLPGRRARARLDRGGARRRRRRTVRAEARSVDPRSVEGWIPRPSRCGMCDRRPGCRWPSEADAWEALLHRGWRPPMRRLRPLVGSTCPDVRAGPPRSRAATTSSITPARPRRATWPRPPSCGSASGGSRSSGSTCWSTGRGCSSAASIATTSTRTPAASVDRRSMRADLVHDEAVRVQRGPDLPLPERSGVPRPDRRARAVRRRRGGHRVARLPEHALRRPALLSAPGSTACPGMVAARQEPSVGHRLVAGQRVRLRRATTKRRPPGSAATTRRGRSTTRARSAATGRATRAISDIDLPDVRADRGDRRPRPVRAASATR